MMVVVVVIMEVGAIACVLPFFGGDEVLDDDGDDGDANDDSA